MISFPEMLLRLGLAMLLGAVVGFEREWRSHEAGMRTNALVSLGSCLFTLLSAYGFLVLLRLPHIQLDPTRIASYIVAGIGFLGAGTIYFSRNRNRVKGLTTAATTWLVAAIGVACGAGLLEVALATTVLGLIVLIALHFVERLLLPRQFEDKQRIRVEAKPVGGQLIGQVYDVLDRAGVRVGSLDVRSEQETGILQIACSVSDNKALVQAISELRALPGVQAVNTSIDAQALTAAKRAQLDDS